MPFIKDLPIMFEFSPDTILMVFASEPSASEDYIFEHYSDSYLNRIN
jgi:hypothetical protein